MSDSLDLLRHSQLTRKLNSIWFYVFVTSIFMVGGFIAILALLNKQHEQEEAETTRPAIGAEGLVIASPFTYTDLDKFCSEAIKGSILGYRQPYSWTIEVFCTSPELGLMRIVAVQGEPTARELILESSDLARFNRPVIVVIKYGVDTDRILFGNNLQNQCPDNSRLVAIDVTGAEKYPSGATVQTGRPYCLENGTLTRLNPNNQEPEKVWTDFILVQ